MPDDLAAALVMILERIHAELARQNKLLAAQARATLLLADATGNVAFRDFEQNNARIADAMTGLED